jgi:UDPglucose 6-dehydrogenase
LKLRLKAPVIFDGRNLYAPEVIEAFGFQYYPIGRPQSRPPQSTSEVL